jgi:hypothetical protein
LSRVGVNRSRGPIGVSVGIAEGVHWFVKLAIHLSREGVSFVLLESDFASPASMPSAALPFATPGQLTAASDCHAPEPAYLSSSVA